MPAPIDERLIAEHEIAVERYGKDEQEPEPPPPVAGSDIKSLMVPRLSVNAPVARFGLDRFGRLDVPQDSRTAGWNPAYSALPGQGGATFLAAHFEYGGVPGVFNRLSAMQPGDEVVVELSDGSRHRYLVTSTIDYALAAIDMGAILQGREGVESLTLMTCSGPGDNGEFPLRTVVLAERVAP
jgi:LPXTG-site transpeptidase (sortase) family protein